MKNVKITKSKKKHKNYFSYLIEIIKRCSDMAHFINGKRISLCQSGGITNGNITNSKKIDQVITGQTPY